MKPAAMLRRTQKRLSREIEMRERTIEVLQVLADLHPSLDILHANPSRSEYYSTLLELGGGVISKVEEAQGVLTGEPLILAQRDKTSNFLPAFYYQRSDRFGDHMATRVMPFLYQVGRPAVAICPDTRVYADWYTKISDFVVKVKMPVLDHGFVLEKIKDGPKMYHWSFEPPEFMDGFDHIQWWTPRDSGHPADRTYFRLDAHGWDG